MSATLSFNPYGTNQPQSSFLLQTQGYVQGTAYDDPSVRMELMGGTLSSTETVVMWGGVPISESVNVAGALADGLGPVVRRSTTQGNTTGFSVYNQAGSMVITPGNVAPVSGNLNYVAFFRYTSNIRIAVQCDPALISALTSGEFVNAPSLYWDVTNYRITLTTTGGNFALPTSTRLLSTNTNSKIVNYNAGAVTWATGSAAIILI